MEECVFCGSQRLIQVSCDGGPGCEVCRTVFPWWILTPNNEEKLNTTDLARAIARAANLVLEKLDQTTSQEDEGKKDESSASSQ